ncbi:MAG: TonB-dependent receptor, partial [Bacteroidales bacterium]|nr:TonB-dependent receptor [Bacteroidales bacterium]
MLGRKWHIILLALLLPLTLSAQTGEAADSPSMLYRGRVARRYQRVFNGTPYWDTLSFKKGKVFYNGILYNDVLVRVDAAEQKLVVQENPKISPVNPDERQISWATRGKDLFVNLNYQGIAAKNGFYLLVSDSTPAIFRRVDKKLLKGTDNHNGSKIGYIDPDYNSDFVDYYHYQESWWMLDGGELVKMRRRKALKLAASRKPDGGFSASLAGWHPVEGTSVELSDPSVKRPHTIFGDGLPLGYFEEQYDVTLLSEDQEAKYKNKVYVVGSGASSKGAKATIEGIITDEEGLALAGVVVVDGNTGAYATSDSRGRYKLTLPKGETNISFTDVEKENQTLNVILYGDGGLNVVLHERTTMLDEAMISAESMRQHRSSDLGVERISAKTMTKIPTVFGEGDLLKVVMTIPGVQTVGEASAGYNVRGGSMDQNLILFNGNTIYYPTHFFGINSVFNPDLIESVELYKGSIPAEFGGRVSSVLDVRSKQGDASSVKGSAGLGVITSRLHMEGPLARWKNGGATTFNLGARLSYSDWILKMLPAESAFHGGGAGFYDANLGITHKADERNTIQLFGYMSSDRFAFGADTTFRYGNANTSLHWQHNGDKISFRASAGFDNYSNKVEECGFYTEAYTLTTGINQAFARFALKQVFSESHTFSYGGEAVLFMLDRGKRRPLGERSKVIAADLPREDALQPAVYFSDRWSPGPKLSVDSGLRLSCFTGNNCFYFYPDVRLSGRYSITPVLSVKGGFNTLSQNIHLVSNTTTISPMDTWKLSDKEILPTSGWQGTSGVYWTVARGRVDLSADVYYKQTRNQLDYGPYAQLVMNEHIADDLVRTRGKAYGVELMVKKSVGHLNGWLAYTWSRSFL